MFRAIAIAAVVLGFATVSVAQAQPDGQGGRYMIEFDRLAPDAPGIVRAAGGSPVHEFPEYNVIAARLPAAAVQALGNHPRVRSIAEDVLRYPFSTGEVTPYGIPMVQADQIAAGADLGQAKVCVIDSGYFVGHEDLPPAGLVTGTNNAGTGQWNEDQCGHGTHVAGTIAAVSNTKGVVGVVPTGALPMHIVKVFGDSCAWTYSSDLITALTTCRDAGAKVVNMSLGGGKAIGPWEERAFNDAYNAGVLLVAAAGNAGNTSLSYPASYNSVISVAAIDQGKVVADFSQKNSQVEVAAPGVDVLSTVPYIETNTLAISDGPTFSGAHISAAARTSGASGGLVNGGRCTSVGSWSGKVVLCERGDVSFKAKVDNVAAGGGRAAVIYNNEPGGFLGTCDGGSGTTCSLPAISLSQADGQSALAHHLGKSSTVVSQITYRASGYESWSGTSMATPHVAGVAALVWSQNKNWTNAQIRQALQATAEDLGAAGRDTSYGFGLVRAKAALCSLDAAFCGSTTPNAPPQASFTFTTSGLSATFTDTSVDSDGSIASRSWNFGDGVGTSTAQNPTYTYGAGGTYTVTLTVTDNRGATNSTTRSVTVNAPAGAITLSARPYKVQGWQRVDLTWSGATSSNVDVHRDTVRVATVANSGSHTDAINKKGGGSYTYRVCHAGTTTCSNSVTVTF
jgi:serine protease